MSQANAGARPLGEGCASAGDQAAVEDLGLSVTSRRHLKGIMVIDFSDRRARGGPARAEALIGLFEGRNKGKIAVRAWSTFQSLYDSTASKTVVRCRQVLDL